MFTKHDIQNALDQISSSKSTTERRDQGLTTLERLLANLVLTRSAEHHISLDMFIQTQSGFQYNVPSRLLSWLASQCSAMKVADGSFQSKAGALNQAAVAQIVASMTLIQGVILMHPPSKEFMGSAYAMDILLDLLLLSRQLSSKPIRNATNTEAGAFTPGASHNQPLAIAVLDTLLCILVDAPPATRVFEQRNGVEVVVKVLKRAGIPREIRMKCLEFLYFYLMDESKDGTNHSGLDQPLLSSSGPSTQPSSPTKPHSSGSVYGSSDLNNASFVTAASQASMQTSCSLSPTPTLSDFPTPPAPMKSSGQPRSLTMLQKDVDFVPISPKKAQVSQLGVGRERPLKLSSTSSKARPLGRAGSNDRLFPDDDFNGSMAFGKARVRSTKEKREILGQLLGNVDALVEGVKKAGIWGLG